MKDLQRIVCQCALWPQRPQVTKAHKERLVFLSVLLSWWQSQPTIKVRRLLSRSAKQPPSESEGSSDAGPYDHSELRNVINALLSSGGSEMYFVITPDASPACLRIASFKVNDCAPLLGTVGRLEVLPSCIRRLRVRTPHNGAVRTLLAVSGGPFWRIPSPVPTSCSKKSPNGWMILLPSAFGTTNVPPLMGVPGEI